MPPVQPATDYDRIYAITRLGAHTWSSNRLALTLNVMLRRRVQTEGSWGGVDAIADLLGGIKPPDIGKIPSYTKR